MIERRECEMLVMTITGGLGAGKSVAARFFQERGAIVFDLDEIARGLLRPGTEAFAKVVDEFGDAIVGTDGQIDRGRLAAVAFATPEAAARLNAAVHPQLYREVVPGLLDLRLLPSQPPLVVLEVPLLVEAPVFAEAADAVLAIAAPEQLRIDRAVAAGMPEADARARMACQATDDERARLADRVIVNDATLERFEAELARFWDEVVAPGVA